MSSNKNGKPDDAAGVFGLQPIGLQPIIKNTGRRYQPTRQNLESLEVSGSAQQQAMNPSPKTLINNEIINTRIKSVLSDKN